MENQNAYKKLLPLFKEYYPGIFIYSIIISFLTLATPISVQSLVNTFSFGPYFQPLFVLSMLLLGLLVLLGFVKSLQYLLVEYLQRKVFSKVSALISRSYILEQHNDMKPNKRLSTANQYFDLITLQKSLSFLVVDGVAIVLQTVLGLILISLYHPFFVAFSFLILSAIILPFYYFSKSGEDSAVLESTQKYKIADHIEALSQKNSSSIDSKENYSQLIKETDKIISEFLKIRNNHFKVLFTQHILYISFFAFFNSLLLGLGGYLVISSQITVGQLVASEIVVNSILYHLLYAKKYLESWYDLYAASEKLNLFLTEDIVETELNKKLATKKIFLRNLVSLRSIYTPQNYKKTLRNFSVATLIITSLVFITPWQQTSIGKGKVLALDPNNREQFITAPISGIIETWLVHEGQRVSKGEVLAKIVDNDPNFLVRLEARRDAAQRKFNAASIASETAKINYLRQEKLVKQGLSSKKDFEYSKISYKKLLSELESAAALLAKSEVDLSRQQQVVVAPRDGQVLRVLQGSGSVNVKSGEPIVTFVPRTQKRVVELLIDGNDLPLVSIGREVRLQFEGWPAVQFAGWPSVAIGSFGGKVLSIDPAVSLNGYFRVLVEPDPNAEEWPDDNFLRQGTRALGMLLLEEVSIGYEVWRKINGFPKSLIKSKPRTEASKGK